MLKFISDEIMEHIDDAENTENNIDSVTAEETLSKVQSCSRLFMGQLQNIILDIFICHLVIGAMFIRFVLEQLEQTSRTIHESYHKSYSY